jgi:hypothetical protein
MRVGTLFTEIKKRTMKQVWITAILLVGSILTNAQTTPASGSTGKTNNAGTQPKKSAAQARGSGQYHGSKDTTPGSPMGTGGAGGNEMSGSPAASASETAIQPEKSNDSTAEQSETQGTKTKKAPVKKKSGQPGNPKM